MINNRCQFSVCTQNCVPVEFVSSTISHNFLCFMFSFFKFSVGHQQFKLVFSVLSTIVARFLSVSNNCRPFSLRWLQYTGVIFMLQLRLAREEGAPALARRSSPRGPGPVPCGAPQAVSVTRDPEPAGCRALQMQGRLPQGTYDQQQSQPHNSR